MLEPDVSSLKKLKTDKTAKMVPTVVKEEKPETTTNAEDT